MGKHGKNQPKAAGGKGMPYPRKAVEKPRVDVTYEGEAASVQQPQPKRPEIRQRVAGDAKAEAATASIDKGKGKARAPHSEPDFAAVSHAGSTSSQASFVIVAGSYEKLLYGLEGTPIPSSSSSTAYSLNPIFIFPAHLACVKAVAASPGGKWLATGSEDEFIKVWDLRRRKEVGSLSQHSGSITSLQFPTSAHLVSTSVDGTISLFRTADWALLKSLKGHSGRVNHVDVHPTGRVALSVGKDKTLKMWDLMRGRGAASLPLSEEAEMVRFSPEGTHLAVLYPKKVEVYTLSFKLLHTFDTKSRFNALEFATVTPSASQEDEETDEQEVLCLGTEKGVVEVWELDVLPAEDEDGEDEDAEDEENKQDGQGELMISVTQRCVLVGHKNRIKSISSLSYRSGPAAESSALLASVSSDGMIHIYDLGTPLSHSLPVGEVPGVQPAAVYDTKGSRLTCVFLAEGKSATATPRHANGHAKHGAPQVKMEDDSDEGEDGSTYEDEDGVSEDGIEVDYEGEEEDEEEDEGEYE